MSEMTRSASFSVPIPVRQSTANSRFLVPLGAAGFLYAGILAGATQAGLIMSEPYASADGAPPASWTASSGTLANNASGSLTYPGLATSTGNRMVVPNGGALVASRQFSPSDPQQAGETYFYSVLFRLDSIGSMTNVGASSQYIMMNSSPTNISQGVATFGWVQDLDNSAKFNFVFGPNGVDGGVAGDSGTRDLVEYTPGDTILLVGSYARTSGAVSLWVNPSAASFGGSAPTATFAGTAALNRPIDYLMVQQPTSANQRAAWTIDEWRVGTTWADVTPAVPEPMTLGMLGGASLLCRRRRVLKEI